MTSDPSQLPREEAIGVVQTAEEMTARKLRPATACRRRRRCVAEGLGAVVFVVEKQRGARGQRAMEAEGSVKKNCSPSSPIYRLEREGVGSNVCLVAADCTCIGPPQGTREATRRRGSD